MKRNGMIDIYRLLFIFFIMAHHLYISGPFATAWIYVEFFFILSGYYTMRHYAGGKNVSMEERAAEAVTYTFHKFKKIIPYAAVAVLLDYIAVYFATGYFEKRHLFAVIENMICELLLLSSSGLIGAYVVPIWYLSAMFLVFPIFTFMLSFRKLHKWYFGFLSWWLAVIYYGKVGIICERAWPHDLLRAFVCLWLGVFVYGVSEVIRKHRSGKGFDVAVTLVEISSFALTILCTGYNTGNNKLIVLAFIIGISAAVSGRSLTSTLAGSPVIGELSMVLFLIHWPVKMILVNVLGRDIVVMRDIALYYVCSIFLSILLLFAGHKIRMILDRKKA